jgi:cupin 2 domain-containing protein
MDNIFRDVKAKLDTEEIIPLLSRPGLRIERIVSTGQASPPDFWYDQAEDEWVILLAGSAGLAIEGEAERTLAPGDYVVLPAGKRHRVTWTDASRPTVWLAVHFGESLS